MSGVLSDGSAASHAAASPSAATAASPGLSPDANYRQIGTRKGNGRLLLGAAHSYHASAVAAATAADGGTAGTGGGGGGSNGALMLGSVPSIPSRFETVLYAGDQEPDAFNSRVARFRSNAADLPGPGSYAGDVVAAGGFGLSGGPGGALKLQSASWSSKGLGVGFVSKAARFKRRGGGPGPASYNAGAQDTLAARASSAPNRGGSSSGGGGTAAFRSTQSAALVPALSSAVQNNNPGPGYYDTTVGLISSPAKTVILTAAEQRKRALKAAKASDSHGASASSLAAHFQSQSLSLMSPEPAFLSRDARFRPVAGVSSSPSSGGAPASATTAAPGSYDPFAGESPFDAPRARATHASFKSTTERTDFTSSTKGAGQAPHVGPGAYTKPITQHMPSSSSHEEKSNESAAALGGAPPLSPSRSFKSTGQDRFGRPLERRTAVEILPGPGSYDPYIPGVRSDSPTRGGPSILLSQRVGPKHPPSSLTSPLAAAQSHGMPPRPAAGAVLHPSGHAHSAAHASPEAKLAGSAAAAAASPAASSDSAGSPARRKKRAAGVGGPGRSLLATRGGPGVALNSPALLLRPAPGSGTFGRASDASPPPAVPGPAFYDPQQAFKSVADKKAFHLNTDHRWM